MLGLTVVPENSSSHAAQGDFQGSGSGKVYFKHIDGLRGLAVALVVIFHIFVGKVSSGVDTFLFIGGLLFLRSQIRNGFDRYGITFTQSVVRIIRRLSPSLIVVVFSTIAASMIIFPVASWRAIIQEAGAATGYWINEYLIRSGKSYDSAGSGVSPFQHLWSMSAQMQCYLFILAVVSIFAYVYHKRGSHMENFNTYRKSIIVVTGVLTLLSFSYAWYVWSTGDHVTNYFSTFSRFWEIGAGCLFGMLILDKIKLSEKMSNITCIIGAAMIIATGAFLDGADQFPGPWTLFPLTGAILVIASGCCKDGHGFAVRALTIKPIMFLASISYCLYLWHWPMLILTMKATGLKANDPRVWIPVISISLALSWITHKWVEIPLRQKFKPERATFKEMITRGYMKNSLRKSSSLWYPASLATFSIATVFIMTGTNAFDAGYSIKSSMTQKKIDSLGGIDSAYPGAASFLDGRNKKEGAPLIPDPVLDAKTMMPQTQDDGCFTDFEGTSIVRTTKDGELCAYGDKESDQTLYLIGGSHSEHYLPPLIEIANKRKFKIVPLIKMGCPLYQEKKWDSTEYHECMEWSKNVVDYVRDNPPTIGIFMTSTRPTEILGKGPEQVPEGYIRAAKEFSDMGIHQWLVRDNPWLTISPDNGAIKDVRVCMNENQENVLEKCGQPASMSYLPINPAIDAYKGIKNVSLLDLSNSYIKDGWVYPEVGGIMVFRDSHHMTKQFTKTMANELYQQMFGENHVPQPGSNPPPTPGTPPVVPVGNASDSTSETSTASPIPPAATPGNAPDSAPSPGPSGVVPQPTENPENTDPSPDPNTAATPVTSQ